MILTDDNFATIVKAVELGRGLYDNLTKYIRFQMGVLVGFIVTFLGASIFNVVGGVPFVPLQTLYVNFTTQVLQAIGLGYGRPAEGLMKRKPRPSDEQILPRPLLIWVAIAGFVMGGATLLLIAWADDHYDSSADRAHDGPDVVRVQQRRLLALHPRRAAARCSRSSVLEDRMFLLCTGGSLAAILLGTELGFLQRILHTVHLDLHQWLVCLVVGLAIVAGVGGRTAPLLARQAPGRRAGSGTSRPTDSAAATRLRREHRTPRAARRRRSSRSSRGCRATTAGWLRGDVAAGIAVTALVVPKNLGYAGIAGVPLENGLYAAAAGALVYALFCTSRHISTGPCRRSPRSRAARCWRPGSAGRRGRARRRDHARHRRAVPAARRLPDGLDRAVPLEGRRHRASSPAPRSTS